MSDKITNDALPLVVFAWQVFGKKDETISDEQPHDVVVKYNKRPKRKYAGLPKHMQHHYMLFRDVVVLPLADDKVVVDNPSGKGVPHHEHLSGNIPSDAITYD